MREKLIVLLKGVKWWASTARPWLREGGSSSCLQWGHTTAAQEFLFFSNSLGRASEWDAVASERRPHIHVNEALFGCGRAGEECGGWATSCEQPTASSGPSGEWWSSAAGVWARRIGMGGMCVCVWGSMNVWMSKDREILKRPTCVTLHTSLADGQRFPKHKEVSHINKEKSSRAQEMTSWFL